MEALIFRLTFYFTPSDAKACSFIQDLNVPLSFLINIFFKASLKDMLSRLLNILHD